MPENDKIKIIIIKFLEFHYTMIYLFCISFDTNFTPKTLEKYHENNTYYLYFINNILKSKKLLDDLHIIRWCCRAQVITYCDLIKIIV